MISSSFYSHSHYNLAYSKQLKQIEIVNYNSGIENRHIKKEYYESSDKCWCNTE